MEDAMPTRRTEEAGVGPLGLPRNLLVPYVLLFLKNWSAHGYQILQTLTMLGFAAVDPATVYRSLRQMEREGLVSSSWQTGAAGPARRTYEITPDGEAFLNQWAEALGTYQRFLDRFFQLYAGGATAPDPASAAADFPGENGTEGTPGTRRARRRTTKETEPA
jgi:PadR family transcriptional regulator, regulatory protein PadR